jgi:anti-sigma B factor antagonist
LSERTLYKTRTHEKAVLIDVIGAIRLGESEQALREKVQELLDAGQRNIAINLAQVSFVDSSGIGAMVRAFTSVTRAGGKLLFFSPTKMIRQTLKMVRLDTVLSMYDDEAAALAAL